MKSFLAGVSYIIGYEAIFLTPSWAYVDPGTTGFFFSSLGYIIGVALAGLGTLLIPFRIIIRRLNVRKKNTL